MAHSSNDSHPRAGSWGEPTRRIEPPQSSGKRLPGERTLPSAAPIGAPDEETVTTAPVGPKKLTVTRVAAWRSRELGQAAVARFRGAAQADGARESGMTALTYAVMLNYASSATMAVGLANTLFFSAAAGESKVKVALYLLITMAPFAFIAPIVGPALDRIQRGRRWALAASCIGQALLAIVMAFHFDDWLLYPAALGMLVLSKSFDVLKASITPRVLPPSITLAKTNARITTFGLVAGGAFGLVATGFMKMFNSPGALWFTAVLCVADAVLCLRIPSWVELTEGEVPTQFRTVVIPRSEASTKQFKRPLGFEVSHALWGNATIRLLTGFLMLFPAFVIKSMADSSAWHQLWLLGLVGAGAGAGSFLGNALGARLHFGKPQQVIVGCAIAATGVAIVAAVFGSVVMAAITALCAATVSALAKISLDSTIQDHVPDKSRASAFGRSETILQLSWVFGGALGVLLPTSFGVGFGIISALLAILTAQTILFGQRRAPILQG